ncbi:glutathione S-transferase family protein [Pseudomonas rubra]|uniref:Glutathione S-transferase family protein n=1 Tax=Pseudomonas rubra TaxID=2942627 RepID=A0ABT5P647_9PSED|nr:glutathione S-transferase family protein [Pseudomonas rubra]MDD1013766.1 glutathione S-transferase family protein [Pseudomonas rubra]MDD1039706.1 glutathione S-transferase family protein [Pseudomonas rubra]MDD1153218.1 glutathione S-transferase family protein [Pseudomonas rubra]
MKLIGMLDSPYVRRVAVSLELYGISFEHQPLSVFRNFTEFAAINPVVKAPSLVLDDGTVLMDSTLILDYFEALAAPAKKLLPQDPLARTSDLQVIGLALAACEKSVQIHYELNLRPQEKLHAPWLERVTGQLRAAYTQLDSLLAEQPTKYPSLPLSQAEISTAVAWSFTRYVRAEAVAASDYPHVQRLAEKIETHSAMLKYPIA